MALSTAPPGGAPTGSGDRRSGVLSTLRKGQCTPSTLQGNQPLWDSLGTANRKAEMSQLTLDAGGLRTLSLWCVDRCLYRHWFGFDINPAIPASTGRVARVGCLIAAGVLCYLFTAFVFLAVRLPGETKNV